ncbi:winged helix-turn-helix transcriptional regulator [Aestuariibacter sp. AA17]|uniref:Winged helix-turn-helix transcriptional regulator n=1 Tax=Fluctibacter corallii TaxID=2984329 RepID=A0ABT3A6T5_9ALTE|nr:winged helix-turn-helix transcriptional regulator [Aestuariibacter sp. AA17]MCV2884397.1 winged helix-turn-helix transcriptional regulator [Aestuariibacter sp. AA17]
MNSRNASHLTLKNIRKNAGLSQKELADRLNISIYLIESIEVGTIDAKAALPSKTLTLWLSLSHQSTRNSNALTKAINFSVWLLLFLFFFLAFFSHIQAYDVTSEYNFRINPDRVSLLLVMVLAYVGRKDPHFIATAFIIIIIKVINDIIFSFLVVDYVDNFRNYLPKILLYVISMLAYILCRKCRYSPIYLITLLTALTTETYWYLNEYPSPFISWYLYVSAECLIVTTLIERKYISITPQGRVEKHVFDKIILRFMAFYQPLIFIVIIEYILRHIGKIDSVFLHTSYSYVASLYLFSFIAALFYHVFSKTKSYEENISLPALAKRVFIPNFLKGAQAEGIKNVDNNIR